MENFVHASVSHAALAEFGRNARAVGVQLHALEIFEKNECMVRWAVAPYSCGDKREMYSLSKSFTSTAAGVAFGMGKLHPDDRVLDWFPEYASLCSGDARWSRLRVGHVLSMNTGHAACVMPQAAFSQDGVRAFFEAPLSHEPGTFFAYNTAASYLAAELVRRAAGRTVPELLARTVFPALGVEEFSWLTCADGRCQGGTGLQASCDDVAKLALLYLNEGEWAGRRVLPREWVHMAAQPHSVNAGNGTPDWCAGYGYQFWMNRRGGFRGDGAFGQLCVVLPENGIAAAVTAECTNMSAELDALWLLLENLHKQDGACADGGLPEAYIPQGRLDGREWDTGWLDFRPNPAGFTGLRVRVDGEAACVWLCDGSSVQKVCAPSGTWRENTLWAKNFRPAIFRQMPREERAPLRFAAAAHMRGDLLVLECRSLNTPHAFEMRFASSGDGMRMELFSPLDVFGEEKLLEAGRPQRKVER